MVPGGTAVFEGDVRRHATATYDYHTVSNAEPRMAKQTESAQDATYEVVASNISNYQDRS